MEPREVVTAFYDALSTSGPDAASAYLADDVTVESPGAPTQGRDEWLAMQRMWRAGLSDLRIDYEVESVEGDTVRGRSHVTGTHSGELDLSRLGIGVVAPTGKAVEMEMPVSWTVKGEKLVAGAATPEEGGGIPGVLAQIGVPLPKG